MYVHVHMYLYIHVYVYAYEYLYVYVNVYVYVYVYISLWEFLINGIEEKSDGGCHWDCLCMHARWLYGR